MVACKKPTEPRNPIEQTAIAFLIKWKCNVELTRKQNLIGKWSNIGWGYCSNWNTVSFLKIQVTESEVVFCCIEASAVLNNVTTNQWLWVLKNIGCDKSSTLIKCRRIPLNSYCLRRWTFSTYNNWWRCRCWNISNRAKAWHRVMKFIEPALVDNTG